MLSITWFLERQGIFCKHVRELVSLCNCDFPKGINLDIFYLFFYFFARYVYATNRQHQACCKQFIQIGLIQLWRKCWWVESLTGYLYLCLSCINHGVHNYEVSLIQQNDYPSCCILQNIKQIYSEDLL